MKTVMRKITLLALLILVAFASTVSAEEEPSLIDKLKQLNKLYEADLITQEEFESTKQAILKNLSSVSHNAVAGSPTADLHAQDDKFIAVVPFYGEVYSSGDRESVATYTVKNCRAYIEKQGYYFPQGIYDFYEAKNILESRFTLNPEQEYTLEQLKEFCAVLKVRFLFFGHIRHLSFGAGWQGPCFRFNVMTYVYDSECGEIVFSKQARQSSRRKITFNHPEKGKAFAKISEQFYFFIDEYAKGKGLSPKPNTD